MTEQPTQHTTTFTIPAPGETFIWYAMRVTYRRELLVKKLLDENEIENFIPMRHEIHSAGRRKVRTLTPAIHNLIFIRTTESILKQFKSRIPYLQFMTRPMGNHNEIITVPNEQMQQFISIASRCDNQLIYLKPNEVNLSKGVAVKIHGGPLDGIEGTFVKVAGVRSKRVVVMIDGVTAIATAEIHPDLIEVIPPLSPI